MMKKLYGFLLVAVMGFAIGAFALDVRTSAVISFTRFSDLTVANNFPHPFRLNSVSLTFASIQNNTFSIILTRTGSTFKLFEYTGSYTNLTWIPEQGLNFNLNDVLRFSNSVNTAATLIYNYEI